ncbi:hypothetical protein H8D30_04945 [bacterium]|nr:hypothetical protein [bacterium]
MKQVIPQLMRKEIEVLLSRFPTGGSNYQAGMFRALLDAFVLDREGILVFEEAWEATGYSTENPGCGYIPEAVESTRQNLVRSLRALYKQKKTQCLWWVEKVRGQGYRIRALDEERKLVLSGNWTFVSYDQAARKRQHRIVVTDGKEIPLPTKVMRRPKRPSWAWGLPIATLALGFWMGHGLWGEQGPSTPPLLTTQAPRSERPQRGEIDHVKGQVSDLLGTFRRLSPEQRRAFIEGLTPKQRAAWREHWERMRTDMRMHGRDMPHGPPPRDHHPPAGF